jgi:alkylated DNA nucleotide flippase Atl1
MTTMQKHLITPIIRVVESTRNDSVQGDRRDQVDRELLQRVQALEAKQP